MSASRGLRVGALVGIIGGVLRVLASFAPKLVASDAARTWVYVVIDVCLVSGLVSLYLARRQSMRRAGTLGAFLALGGLIAGRILPAITDLNLYPVTGAAVAIGVLILAISEWRAKRMPASIWITFALSLVVGSIGTFNAGAHALFILSGILFGGAFAAMAMNTLNSIRRGGAQT